MYQEYRTQAFIASSPNGWMNTEVTLQWVENVIRAFSFKQKLLAWDFKECNIEDTAKMLLATKKIDTVTVPGGYAKYLQVPDVSWNENFKANCTEKYDDWLATDGINNEMKGGNVKAPAWKEIIKSILSSLRNDQRVVYTMCVKY